MITTVREFLRKTTRVSSNIKHQKRVAFVKELSMVNKLTRGSISYTKKETDQQNNRIYIII